MTTQSERQLQGLLNWLGTPRNAQLATQWTTQGTCSAVDRLKFKASYGH
jgi:hypothetical protein